MVVDTNRLVSKGQGKKESVEIKGKKMITLAGTSSNSAGLDLYYVVSCF